MRGLYTLRGLHGQRRYGRDPVAIVRGKSFQIGCNARATGRIKSSNGQNNWESRSVMVIVQRAAASMSRTTAGRAKREEQANNPDCTRLARRSQDFFRDSASDVA